MYVPNAELQRPCKLFRFRERGTRASFAGNSQQQWLTAQRSQLYLSSNNQGLSLRLPITRSLQLKSLKNGWRLISLEPPPRLPSLFEVSTISSLPIKSCQQIAHFHKRARISATGFSMYSTSSGNLKCQSLTGIFPGKSGSLHGFIRISTISAWPKM